MWGALGRLILDLPWIYRGWCYLFSSKYRAEAKEDWKEASPFFKGIDIFMSLVFMAAEIYLIYLAYKNNI